MGILFDFDRSLTIIITGLSNSGPESSESSSGEGSDSESESEGDLPTPQATVGEVGEIPAPSVPGSCSPAGSARALSTVRPSDDSNSDSGSRGSTSSDDSSLSPGCAPGPNGVSGQESCKMQKVKAAGIVSTQAVGPSQKSDGSRAVAKRRRTDKIGNAVVTSISRQPKVFNSHEKGNSGDQPRRNNTPFTRIKVDEVKFADERLKDNTFESRKAAANDYGAKANADLIVTKGANFRKEKNKKKRGNYRGGEITVRQAVTRGHCPTNTVSI